MNGKARQPVTDTFHVEGSFPSGDCGDFQIIEHMSADIRRITFFDETGQPCKRQAHIDNVGTYTNSATGKEITTSDHFVQTRDLELNTMTWVGLTMHIRVPGQGVLAMSAGRLGFDPNGNITFEAGQQDVRNEYEAVMCPLLR